MSTDIEVLEQIKKGEDSSDKKITEADAKAKKTVEDAKMDAQKLLDDAKKKADEYRQNAMQKTKKEAQEKGGEIIEEMKGKAQRIKMADKTTVLTLFKKAVKERFGV